MVTTFPPHHSAQERSSEFTTPPTNAPEPIFSWQWLRLPTPAHTVGCRRPRAPRQDLLSAHRQQVCTSGHRMLRQSERSCLSVSAPCCHVRAHRLVVSRASTDPGGRVTPRRWLLSETRHRGCAGRRRAGSAGGQPLGTDLPQQPSRSLVSV